VESKQRIVSYFQVLWRRLAGNGVMNIRHTDTRQVSGFDTEADDADV